MTAPGTGQPLAGVDSLPEPERTARILAALEDEAPAAREQAIRYAARYVEPARLVHLVGNDERALLRNSAIAALDRQGPYAVPPLEQVLAGPVDAELAMFTLQVLTRIADASSTPAVLPYLRHENANVAQAAIEALGAFRATEGVADLIALMGGNLWLQLAAVNALGEIGDARAAEPLLALAPDSLLAIPALQALGKLPAAAVAEPLARLLCDGREPASREAALAALGDVIAREPAAQAVGHALESIRLAAGEPTLIRLLQGAVADGPSDPADAGRLRIAAALVVLAAPIAAMWTEALIAVASAAPTDARQVLLTFSERVGPLVAARLRDGSPAVRAALLEHASPSAITPPLLLEALGDAHPLVRAAASRALSVQPAESATGRLVELLATGDDEERAAATQALGALPAESLAPLAACLSAARPELVVQALAVLERAGGQLHADRVLDLGSHASPHVRRAALRVAAGLRDRRVEPMLLRALADVDPDVPAEALELLVQRGGKRTLDSLIALLSLEDSLRFRVIRALGRLRCAAAAPKLEALYHGCPLHEQLEIVGALVLIGASGVRPFLRAQLEAANLELRRAAARGLASIADPEDLALLQALAADRDWNLRNEAARGLARLPLAESRPLLLALARDVEPVVAVTAREAFRGTPARTWAVPA